MKKIKFILPLLAALAVTVSIFAFKAKAVDPTCGRYIMDQGTDPDQPSSYSFRSTFNAQN